jgi:hypothetical protein
MRIRIQMRIRIHNTGHVGHDTWSVWTIRDQDIKIVKLPISSPIDFSQSDSFRTIECPMWLVFSWTDTYRNIKILSEFPTSGYSKQEMRERFDTVKIVGRQMTFYESPPIVLIPRIFFLGGGVYIKYC